MQNLHIRDLPIPEPRPGWVRIKVMAFGLNRSELHTRLGYAQGVTLPRVLGIEAVGVVDTDPDGGVAPGQQVATLMGGMGPGLRRWLRRVHAGARGQVIPFTTDLPWEVIGAVPETLQTAYGSLTTGLDLAAGQTLVVRGGTSTVGLAAITVAKDMDASVIATTRQPDRVQALLDHGADHSCSSRADSHSFAGCGGRIHQQSRGIERPDVLKHGPCLDMRHPGDLVAGSSAWGSHLSLEYMRGHVVVRGVQRRRNQGAR